MRIGMIAVQTQHWEEGGARGGGEEMKDEKERRKIEKKDNERERKANKESVSTCLNLESSKI